MGLTPTDQHRRLALLVDGPTVRGRYRHDWGLFTDWCSAVDQTPLPATPHTLAEFLHEHPAATATQRRRVSAINTVHRDHGHPPPGRSETVRRRLDAVRAARLDQRAAALRQRADQLPTTGWPAGLFGRRDALLLDLAATGMSFTQITRLRRGDLTTDDRGRVVAVVDGEQFRLAPQSGEDTDHSPAAIHQRWAQVLAFLDRYPNTRMLASHLTDPHKRSVPALTDRQTVQPLLQPIDRWGHLPLPAQAMTPQSVAALVHTHLTGPPPTHRALPLREEPTTTSEPAPVPPPAPLDPGYYERGITARRHAQDHLADVLDILDDVEDRADRILNDLLTLLEDM